jgi:hypothetical protein
METKIEDIYEIRNDLLGAPKVEAVGDNKIDNMMADLKLAAGVELERFAMKMLADGMSKFAQQYATPEYLPFKEKVVDLIMRYRVTDGEEQADLFNKIQSMFKQIFVEKFGADSAEKAGVLAMQYAEQMIAIFKKNSAQANTEMYPKDQTVY